MDGLSSSLEANFDGLVGPTHNYAGLSFGNVASKSNQGLTSRPLDAVLQGIDKMAYVHGLGIPQGVFPPQERPRLDILRSLGFQGGDSQLVQEVGRTSLPLLASVYSASAMWAANAGTITASADSKDGLVHLSAANLASTFHRSLEPESTARILERVFPAECFVHHGALPSSTSFGDEGAANHTRLFNDKGEGHDWFVFGRRALAQGPKPTVYPARQTLEASQAIARRHRSRRAIFTQQSPGAIDAGAFHNDVVCVGHGRTLLWHESAFDSAELMALRDELRLTSWCVSEEELPLAEAIRSYLFNSQLLSTADGLHLLAPSECFESAATAKVIERLIAEGAIASAHHRDLKQSMRNGGGPACLRLRVPLTEDELAQVHGPCLLDDEKFAALRSWAQAHYREELAPSDLADPALIIESRAALDALTQLLDLGDDFYRFQRA